MINIGGNIYTNFFCLQTSPQAPPSNILLLTKSQSQRSAFIDNICETGDGQKQLFNSMPCKYQQFKQMSIYLASAIQPHNFKCRQTIKSCLKYKKWGLVLLQSRIQIQQQGQQRVSSMNQLFLEQNQQDKGDNICIVLREMKKMATLFKKDYNHVVILLSCSTLKHFQKKHSSRLSIQQGRDADKKDGFQKFAGQLIDEDIHQRVILYSNASSDMKKLAQTIQYCASKNIPKSFDVNNFSLNNYLGFKNKSDPFTPSFMIIQQQLEEEQSEEDLKNKILADKQNVKLYIVATIALFVFLVVTLIAISTHFSASQKQNNMHNKIIHAMLHRNFHKNIQNLNVQVIPSQNNVNNQVFKQNQQNVISDLKSINNNHSINEPQKQYNKQEFVESTKNKQSLSKNQLIQQLNASYTQPNISKQNISRINNPQNNNVQQNKSDQTTKTNNIIQNISIRTQQSQKQLKNTDNKSSSSKPVIKINSSNTTTIKQPINNRTKPVNASIRINKTQQTAFKAKSVLKDNISVNNNNKQIPQSSFQPNIKSVPKIKTTASANSKANNNIPPPTASPKTNPDINVNVNVNTKSKVNPNPGTASSQSSASASTKSSNNVNVNVNNNNNNKNKNNPNPSINPSPNINVKSQQNSRPNKQQQQQYKQQQQTSTRQSTYTRQQQQQQYRQPY